MDMDGTGKRAITRVFTRYGGCRVYISNVVREATVMDENARIFAIIMLCGIIGIMFALICGELHTQTIMLDDFLTDSFTIRELQFLVFIGWVIFGIFLAALHVRG